MQVLFKNNQGMVLVVLIMIMVILLSITGASLLFSRLNLKSTASYKTGGAIFQIADAGIQHALAVIPAAGDFDALLEGSVSGFPCGDPCDGTSNKPTLSGSLAGSAYSVVVLDDDDGGSGNPYIDDTNKIVILTSTATGPNKSQRSIVAYIQKVGTNTPPGAVYIPGHEETEPKFKTTGNFFITGDDTSYTDADADGWADSTSAGPDPSVLGIAVGNATLTNKFLNSLNDAERALVQGKGYDGSTTPHTPSIAIPDTNMDVAGIANYYKDQIDPSMGCPPRCITSLEWKSGDCPSTNPCTLGTDSVPQITYIKNHAHLDGYITGSGVLIVEGKTHFFGNFEFHGLVISVAPGALSDGTVEENLKLKFKNNATIFGSILLGPNQDKLKFDIKDNASIRYSSQALNNAYSKLGGTPLGFVKLAGWLDPMQ